MNFYNAAGLDNFETLVNQIISLSPYDGMKLPTVSFYSNMEGVSDMLPGEFIDLLSIKISYIRNSMVTERNRQIERNSRR